MTRSSLHATASDEDGEGLKGIGEHVPLAPAIGRCGAFWAEDDASQLSEVQIEGVEDMAPEEKGSSIRVSLGDTPNCTSIGAQAAVQFAMDIALFCTFRIALQICQARRVINLVIKGVHGTAS